MELAKILEQLRAGLCTVDDAHQQIRSLTSENLSFARLDHERSVRQGFPEVIFGSGKTADELVSLFSALERRHPNILATRIPAEVGERLVVNCRDAIYYPRSRVVSLVREPTLRGFGTIAVVSAGTSDLPIAEEAAVTARTMGNRVDEIVDVGVAGLHRLLERLKQIRQASVVVVVAGMDGALPSVIGGLVQVPVIAVPTSIGYGTAFEGLAALLTMLNSCSAGVTVVNIDNGFGAGFAASVFNRRRPE